MAMDSILRAAANGDFTHYCPQTIIEAVNALLPLGKEGALASLEAFLAEEDLQADPLEGLFLVLRTLFEVPIDPGYHLPLRLGSSTPPPPVDPASLPHFPLVLIGDCPLLLVSGFALGGDGEPLTAHLRHFRANGTLRRNPLEPSGTADQLLSQFRLIFQRAYDRAPSSHETTFVEAQLAATCLHRA
jgi:hypothetical protein